MRRFMTKIKGLIREVDFIPETRNINSLFAMMQAAKSHLVIVVDEYGQTAGIVAMEDILEEIVGNIEDEHDEETNMVELQPDGSYLMSGMAPFDEVVEVLGIPLDVVKTSEGPGYGAALLAMVACGEYETVAQACSALVRTVDTVEPDASLTALYEERYRQFRQIYPVCRALFPKLL